MKKLYKSNPAQSHRFISEWSDDEGESTSEFWARMDRKDKKEAEIVQVVILVIILLAIAMACLA